MRTRLIVTLTLACFTAGLAAFKFFSFGYGQCHPRRTVVTVAERASARATLPGLTDVSFEGQGGVTLRGWFVPPRNGVVLIMVHGLWSNRAGLLPEAAVFARHGYGILLYDSRAHGESGGTAATWGSSEAFDVAAAISFVRQKPHVAHVALLGFSVGASAVARAAANDPSVEAVILYATWTSLREEIAYKESSGGWLGVQCSLLGFRYSGVLVDQIRPEADLPRISPRPLLMVSGGQDADTPPRVMDHLYSVATGDKHRWRLPECGHGGYYQAEPTQYEQRLVGFLDSVFARAR